MKLGKQADSTDVASLQGKSALPRRRRVRTDTVQHSHAILAREQSVGQALGMKLWAGTNSAPAANFTLPPATAPTTSTVPPATVAADSTLPSSAAADLALPPPSIAAVPPLAKRRSGGSKVGTSAGGAVGGVSVLLALVMLAWRLIVRCRRRKAAAIDAKADAGGPATAGAGAGVSSLAAPAAPARGASMWQQAQRASLDLDSSEANQYVLLRPSNDRSSFVLSGRTGSGSGADYSQRSLVRWSADTSGLEEQSHTWRLARQPEFGQAAAQTMLRIAPAANTTDGVPLTGGFSATLVRPSTLAEPGAVDKLLTALDNMASAEPPQLFAGRYRLKTEWVRGGQALVVFARDDGEGFFQYAIKCAARVLCASVAGYQPPNPARSLVL